MSSYSDDYFGRIQGGALRSALCAVPIILEYIDLSSVIDVGCGSGAWLSAFQQHGVRDVIGVDGAWVNADRLPFSAERFVASDLTKALHLDREFDLVLSFEVAEHLPPDCAKTFVESLTSLGPVILFSAAVPGQGGTDHMNEQWPDYWARLFVGFGFRPVDCLRSRFWGLAWIADWWVDAYPSLMRRLEPFPRVQSIDCARAFDCRGQHPVHVV